jgi:hypothetical protein
MDLFFSRFQCSLFYVLILIDQLFLSTHFRQCSKQLEKVDGFVSSILSPIPKPIAVMPQNYFSQIILNVRHQHPKFYHIGINMFC